MTTISISYDENDHDNSVLALSSIDELEEGATGEVYLGQSKWWRENDKWVTYSGDWVFTPIYTWVWTQ
jgi:hypothetical protein